MATLKQATTLKHQANLGEEVEEISFQAGQELTVLREWEDHLLCKDDDGKLFNVPRELIGGQG